MRLINAPDSVQTPIARNHSYDMLCWFPGLFCVFVSRYLHFLGPPSCDLELFTQIKNYDVLFY